MIVEAAAGAVETEETAMDEMVLPNLTRGGKNPTEMEVRPLNFNHCEYSYIYDLPVKSNFNVQ